MNLQAHYDLDVEKDKKARNSQGSQSPSHGPGLGRVIRPSLPGGHMATYIALLRKEKKGVYGVDFPDFPGCITAGETLEEAGKRASEALWFHIWGMLEDGEPIPEPSTLDEVAVNPDHADATHFMVTVPDVKSKRINISLPETILKQIDAHAEQRGMSRFAFLVEAAKEPMKEKASKTGKRSTRPKRPHSRAS